AVIAETAAVFSRAEFSTITNLDQREVDIHPEARVMITDQRLGVFRYQFTADRPGVNLRLAAGDTLFKVRIAGEPFPFRARLTLFNGAFRRNLPGVTASVPLAHVFTPVEVSFGLDTVRLRVRQVADTVLAGMAAPCLEFRGISPSRASELLLSLEYDEQFLRPDTVREGALTNYSAFDSISRFTFADIFPGFSINQEFLYLGVREPVCNGLALPVAPVAKLCLEPLRDTFETTVELQPFLAGNRQGFARLRGCTPELTGLFNLPLSMDTLVTVRFPFVRDSMVSNTNSPAILTGLRLYPNPTQNEVRISGWLPGDVITIYANDGRRLRSSVRGNKLDFRKFPLGLYHVIVRRGERLARFPVLRQ
ncbi:MAG: T9SS type A sorting domain-containing protein, partial [Bacteroidota bacterium]